MRKFLLNIIFCVFLFFTLTKTIMSNENEKIFKRQGTGDDCKTDSECHSQICQVGSFICEDKDFRLLEHNVQLILHVGIKFAILIRKLARKVTTVLLALPV
ncbi:hypothetical protein C2G38_2112556 [Gigaspora rosea]|uniref:Uncharacterized protein n=1 Tax=Gigaspora rosea TaxID=44941 RepID=A0A397UGG4_9GLOM|nr:hypothetical protein C2G38_2112556 [Gigaspora rosea]